MARTERVSADAGPSRRMMLGRQWHYKRKHISDNADMKDAKTVTVVYILHSRGLKSF